MNLIWSVENELDHCHLLLLQSHVSVLEVSLLSHPCTCKYMIGWRHVVEGKRNLFHLGPQAPPPPPFWHGVINDKPMRVVFLFKVYNYLMYYFVLSPDINEYITVTVWSKPLIFLKMHSLLISSKSVMFKHTVKHQFSKAAGDICVLRD